MAPPTENLNALEVTQATVAGRINDINLSLPPGTLAGLVGPNGSGKSTLLQVAGGLLPSQGAVKWNGRKLDSISLMERGRTAAWVPQDARFEFGFTVQQVVAQGRFAHGDDDYGVMEILERLDLKTLADRPVNRLSGGERQRVLLARALATQAPLQLWDEPLAQLDPRHALEVLELARSLTRGGGTLLFSLHDLRLAHRLDVVVVLQSGRLRAFGKPADVLMPKLLMDVFNVRVRLTEGLSLELP
jgi:iron complex transport system ATP-binding protein